MGDHRTSRGTNNVYMIYVVYIFFLNMICLNIYIYINIYDKNPPPTQWTLCCVTLDIRGAVVNTLVCWFCSTSTMGHFLFSDQN